MASQKDLNDMLNLTPGQQQQQQQQKGGKLTKVLKKDKGEEALVFTKKRRRPKGCIGREVEQLRQASIHLTNNAQPSIVPDYSGKAGDDDGNGGAGGGEDGFKKKRSLLLAKGEGGESGGTKWVWKGFTNPARGEHDKTVFYHWAPSTDVNDEYEFARFNKKAPVITYTKDEYRDNLTGPSASDYGKNVFTNEDEEEDFEYYDVTNDESSDESESDDDDDDDDNNNDDDDGSNNGSSDNGNKNSGVNDKTKSNNECSVNEDSESVYAKRSSSRNSNKNNTKKKRRRKRKTERKSITARFSDTNWTEKETDKLFELCERYDLRWVVITDRWNTDVIAENEGDDSDVESNTSSSVMGDSQGLRVYNYRTMEELKGRYYHVASKIATARKLPKANPYISYNFNISKITTEYQQPQRMHTIYLLAFF